MKTLEPTQKPVTSWPETETLARGLSSILGNTVLGRERLVILDRNRSVPSMTFPTEVVTCRVGRRRPMKLFCKYEAGRTHNAYGHRGGVAYEAEVYRRLLRPLGTTTPRFIGAWNEPASGDHWLIIEYLEDSVILRDLPAEMGDSGEPTGMSMAAGWIGRFHAETEGRSTDKRLSFLNRYDAGYYLGWAQRTSDLAGPLHGRHRWLRGLCRCAGELLRPLLTAATGVVHGEYYENNILVCRRAVYPTDWESAAIGPGEIDLAALTEGPWNPDIVRQCKMEYQQARWPEGAPKRFESTLAAARLYLHFRWLGERSDWTQSEECGWRFEELGALARQAGLAGRLVGWRRNDGSPDPFSPRPAGGAGTRTLIGGFKAKTSAPG
jgi:hypothetical protein